MTVKSKYTRIALALILITGLGTGISIGMGMGEPLAVNAQGTTNSPSSNSLKGALTSIQNDPTDNSTSWIVSGVFRMDNKTGTAAQASSPTFNASFYMVKTDGTALHTHEIYDLQLAGPPSKSDNSTIFNGTSTVTMRDGPVQDVPTSITLLDDSAVGIWFDPNKVNNHFGETPLFGTQHLVCVESPQYCK